MDILNICSMNLIKLNDIILVMELFIAVNTLSMLVFSVCNKYMGSFKDWKLLEIFWTIFPSMLLIVLGLPSLKMLYMAESFNYNTKMTLKICGYQWYWEYNYIEMKYNMVSYPKLMSDFIRLGESNILCLPYKIKIRLLITSNDVLHSWSMPSLGFKIDACPGRLNFFLLLFKTPFKSVGQCSELCGTYHSWMPIYLESMSMSIFLNWIKMNI